MTNYVATCSQPNMLYDVLEFGVLGVGCAGAAVALYEGVRVSEVLMRPLPRWISAPLAGGLCGVVAFQYPQVGSEEGGQTLRMHLDSPKSLPESWSHQFVSYGIHREPKFCLPAAGAIRVHQHRGCLEH